MLSRNSIFLKLIGSFYEQVGLTDFHRSFDNIYSNFLFQRYVDIISRSVSTGRKSSIFNAVHFGFVLPEDVDVVNKRIKIKNINNAYENKANFISLGFLAPDNIHSIYFDDDWFVADDGVISEIAEYATTGPIPVVYGSVGRTDRVIAEWISVNSEITDELIVELGADVLESVSKYILYADDSKSKLEKLANILLGAIHARDFEEVIKIDNNFVYTSKNQYELSGFNTSDTVIVSVGDTLRPLDLITKVATVANGVQGLVDIQKIQAFISANGLSLSNIEYLTRLSEEVAKRKIVINILSDVITSTDTDTLSIISKLISSFNVEAIANSESLSYDSITAVSSEGMLTVDSAECLVELTEKWILDVILPEIIANADTSDGLAAYDSSDVLTAYTEAISGDMFISEDISPSEKSLEVIVDSMDNNIDELEDLYGYLTETNFADIGDTGGLLQLGEDSLSIYDGGDEVKDGTASFYESISISDYGVPDILARDIAYSSILDALSYHIKDINTISIPDETNILLDIGEIDTIGILESDRSLSVYNDSASMLDDIKHDDISISDIFNVEEDISSYGLHSVEDFADIDSSRQEILNTFVEVATGFDSSSVESDNEIDE